MKRPFLLLLLLLFFNYSKYKCLGLKPQKTHIDNKYGTPLWLKLKPMPSPPDQKILACWDLRLGYTMSILLFWKLSRRLATRSSNNESLLLLFLESCWHVYTGPKERHGVEIM